MKAGLPSVNRYAFGGGTKPLSEIMFHKYDADNDGINILIFFFISFCLSRRKI